LTPSHAAKTGRRDWKLGCLRTEGHRTDREMVELMGSECCEAVARDAAGWPIARERTDFDA